MSVDVRGLGRQIRPAERFPTVRRAWGVVTAVVAGSPPTVSVKLSGSNVATAGVRYMAGYSPAVNDTVSIDLVGGDIVVTGKLA